MTLTPTAALDCAARGWRVHPLEGKRAVVKGWPTLATTDPATLAQWQEEYPGANWGIATGKQSNLFVLDIDPQHGGDESLRALTAQYGELPETVEVVTGRGGRHLYFRYPGGGYKNSFGRLGPGLDIKTDGGYVVAVGSIHPDTGRTYEWEAAHHPDDVPLAEAPAWLLTLLTQSPPTPGNQPVRSFEHGSRNTDLTSEAGKLRRIGLSEPEILGALRAINAERCNSPVPDDEVRKIAHSIGQYPAPVADEWPQLDRLAIRGVIGDFVRTVEPHTEADSAAILVQSLVAFGNTLNRSSYFQVEADRHHTNLDAVMVGDTSKGRKGTSFAYIRKVFNEVDPEWTKDRILSGLSSGEGVIWSVRDPIFKHKPNSDGGQPTDGSQMVMVDPGIEDKRLLVMEGEFAQCLHVMKREGNILNALLRLAWDSGDLRILNKNSPAQSTGAHISIIGHITKDELCRHLDGIDAANGFLNRILWICVRRSKVLPEGGSLDETALEPIIDRLRQAVQFGRTAGELKRDKAARDIWREVYPTLSEGKPGLLGAALGRAEAQVTRLSCLYALQDNSYFVTSDHLNSALALWEYCEASARYIFGQRLGDPIADELLRALRLHPTEGMTRTQISDHFGRNRKAFEIDRGLAALAERNLADVDREATEGGGRPVERWRLASRGTK